MFTGLIIERGTLIADPTPSNQGGVRLTIGLSPDLSARLAIGDSLAVSGVCLTILEKGPDRVAVELSPETLSRTTLGGLRQGDAVNLELALRMGDPLGGHWVQGHVDGTGHVAERLRQGDWELVWFTCSEDLSAQMVPKGSVAVDGVSLTVVEVGAGRFSAALIPHTLAVTTLGLKQPGATVNLETDLFAKYIWKYTQGLRS